MIFFLRAMLSLLLPHQYSCTHLHPGIEGQKWTNKLAIDVSSGLGFEPTTVGSSQLKEPSGGSRLSTNFYRYIKEASGTGQTI